MESVGLFRIIYINIIDPAGPRGRSEPARALQCRQQTSAELQRPGLAGSHINRPSWKLTSDIHGIRVQIDKTRIYLEKMKNTLNSSFSKPR